MSVEYHWMISYIVPKVGSFNFRQKSGVCQPKGRTRSEMFTTLAGAVMEEDGLAVADFAVVYFGLEPNRLEPLAGESAAPQVHVGEMRIHDPEDSDPEKLKRELRITLGRCVECGNWTLRCVCPPPAVRNLSEAIKDAHDMLKQVVKDYGLSNNLLVVADEQEQG